MDPFDLIDRSDGDSIDLQVLRSGCFIVVQGCSRMFNEPNMSNSLNSYVELCYIVELPFLLLKTWTKHGGFWSMACFGPCLLPVNCYCHTVFGLENAPHMCHVRLCRQM